MLLAAYRVIEARLQEWPVMIVAVGNAVNRNNAAKDRNSKADEFSALPVLERDRPGTQVPLGTMPQV